MKNNIITQFDILTKRMLTWNYEMNVNRRIICLLQPNPNSPYRDAKIFHKFNKDFIKIFVTYKNRSKLIRQADEIINPEFTKKPLKEKIIYFLKNPDSLIDYSFKMIIPVVDNTVEDMDLNKTKTRIRKKINKLRKIGKII